MNGPLGTRYAGADLRNQDLRNTDLTGQSFFGADLRGAKLYGASIDLRCETFDGVKLSDDQVALLLLMLSQADIDPRFQEALRTLVRSVIGDEAFALFSRYLQLV